MKLEMKQALTTLLVLCAAISACRGTTDGKGQLYPFEITTELVCHVQSIVNGETSPIPETPPTIPVQLSAVPQQGERVYLPQEST